VKPSSSDCSSDSTCLSTCGKNDKSTWFYAKADTVRKAYGKRHSAATAPQLPPASQPQAAASSECTSRQPIATALTSRHSEGRKAYEERQAVTVRLAVAVSIAAQGTYNI
jgi:hypothetical protein